MSFFLKRISMDYPIRINKYLALKNICSRREADELIKKGWVKINGLHAKIGAQVNKDDKVTVSGTKKYFYYALNKPKGIITHSPQEGEKSIEETIQFPNKVFPLGRLDKDSSGLIILTNDGRITDRLLNPKNEHEKEYIVKIDRPITEAFLEKMKKGIVLEDGYRTKPCQTEKRSSAVFSIILTEGKKRQIRKMCDCLNRHVVSLKRIRIMNIFLGDLKIGAFRAIKKTELKEFLKLLGIESLE